MCKNTFENEIKSGAIVALFEESSRYNTASSYREVNYKERNRWYDVTSTSMTWVDGRRVVLYAIIDVTEKKQYQKKIEQQANNDFLTGLYNRMCCERDLLRIIDEAKECGGKGAVIYLDLDDFKHINDGLGHQYGDVLLKAISSSLTRINGVENTCYRMGGDEFVILVPHTSYDRFEQIIESIRVVFNKPWFLKGADYYCTSSIGVVTFPDEGETVQDLIRKADIAMYTAKKSGKNKLAHYTDSSDEEAYKRLDMEKSMRAATATDYDQFEVYYQPIVDITKPGNPCTGAEALIRWNSTELGFISPADFIPLAEYLGLINPIGHHVLQKACEAVKYWNENGHPYYKVNVNLSVVQLMQNDIVDTIAKTIEETEVNPRNLTLEVTESLAINDMERMKRILGNIKKLGIRIALDDFGTGYSSLNHIREIPLDVIKVDQSFVKDLATDQYAQSFVRMIGELADALGVRVCVEGIETAEQFKALENMNVRMVQGFYFDKPMPRDAFERKYLI
jgi:diguanylate cyclase (GGDEF)-like protein